MMELYGDTSTLVYIYEKKLNMVVGRVRVSCNAMRCDVMWYK